MNSWGIYGGTFDPIHNGHTQTAEILQNKCAFSHLVFLPCKIPPLKNPAHAAANHRLIMLERALLACSYPVSIDCREMQRTTPSYTITTLKEYRREKGVNASITFIMGMDSFINLEKWYCFEKILLLSNLLVLERPGYSSNQLSAAMRGLLEQHYCNNPGNLKKSRYGLIATINAGNFFISSSLIRSLIIERANWQEYLSPEVADYINHHQLYKNM